MLAHLRPPYRVMPWKNGQGSTTELLLHPLGASLDDFVYRLSIADLGAAGPFSLFAGYDRILVQLEGQPMTLSHEGHGDHPLSLLRPHRFAGEWPTHGHLVPPARDFNLMVRRAEASADLAVHQLAAGESAQVKGDRETRLAFVLRGIAAISLGGETARVAAGEAVLATNAAALRATAAPGGATVFLIAIGAAGRYPAG